MRSDGGGKRTRLEAETAENGRNQPERGNEFAEQLAEAVARGVRDLKRRKPEHQMRGYGPE